MRIFTILRKEVRISRCKQNCNLNLIMCVCVGGGGGQNCEIKSHNYLVLFFNQWQKWAPIENIVNSKRKKNHHVLGVKCYINLKNCI